MTDSDAWSAIAKRVRRFGNLCVVALLRSPLHPLLSGSIVLVTYRGRRSGRRFTVPVMYADAGGDLIVFVAGAERKSWWRNLRGGADVVHVRGRRERGRAVVTGAEAAPAYVARYPRARRSVTAAGLRTFVRIVMPNPATAAAPS